MRKKIIATKVPIILAISLNGYAADKTITTPDFVFDENMVYDRVNVGDTNKGGGSATVNNTVLTIQDTLDIGWGHRSSADFESDTNAGKAISRIEESIFNIINQGQVKMI